MFDQQVILTKRLIDMESKHEEFLNNFKGEIMRLESQIYVHERVTDALRVEVDRLQQYTRRPCVAIHGIAKDRNERYSDLKHKVSNIIQSVNSTMTTVVLRVVNKKSLSVLIHILPERPSLRLVRTRTTL